MKAVLFASIFALVLVVANSAVQAASLSGAIFTTTPDGSFVNQNVKYNDKKEVYLDGGPPINAPASAAGLPDDIYVFQITDPSGKILLSQDPARCRMIEAMGGIIVRRVPPSEPDPVSTDNWANSGPSSALPCHVDDDPPHPTDPGVTGASGQHDTNVDADHGSDGSILVQMMPYGTTPNPGGVYKAWVTPLSVYEAKGGNVNHIPNQLGAGLQKPHACPDFCAKADKAFGPSRDQIKTDNFKVLGDDSDLMFDVIKWFDQDGNGVWDESPRSQFGRNIFEDLTVVGYCVEANGDLDENCISPTSGGWPFLITDPLGVTQLSYTPIWVIGDVGQYTVEEVALDGWQLTGVHKSFDPDPLPTELIQHVTVPEIHLVVFGNKQIE
ncbi:MAG: hypothetical protein O2821_12135 [Chloroflexi bacterium]|nr:hypothetical protein [Chloroflexota bacterium]MDA1228784.1 hypothetical protein [Chloroflexota bacterium]